MSPQRNFAYWRQRIEETPDSDQLDGAVEEAVDALLGSFEASPEVCAQLSEQVRAFVSRKQDLSLKKQRALKILEPLTLINKLPSQQGVAGAPASPPPPVEAREKPPPAPSKTFEHAFTESLCDFMCQKLKPWHITKERSSALPFILAPGFSEVFEQVIREYIVPAMLDNRRIKMMAESMNMSECDEEHFMAEFELPIKENVTRYVWDNRWDAIKNTLTSVKKAEEENKKEKGKKKSLLSKITRKKAPTYLTTAIKINEEIEKEANQVWDLVNSGCKEHNYDPLEVSDILVFQAMFEYEPDKIAKAMDGIVQMLRQEAKEGEGREGSGRQYMCSLINKHPPYCGELLALWTYFSCPEDFSGNIQNGYVASQGTNVKARKRRMPLFFRWVSAEAGGIS